MNPDEQQTEELLDQSKQTILQKYHLHDPKTLQLPNLHLKLLTWIFLFVLLVITYNLALPVPAQTSYPTNIWNFIFTYISLLWFAWIPFVLGIEIGKRRKI